METSLPSSAVSRSCLEGFINLCKSLKGLSGDHRFTKQISLVDIEDELGRFRVWAGNIGALQAGHSSLEYRLREASLVLQNVLKLLNELNALLHEITLVTLGTRLPYDEQIKQNDSESEDDSNFGEIETDQDEAPKTELERNYLSIIDIIDSLYKLSIYIRNPTSRTRFSKAASFQVVDPETGIDLFGRYQDFDIEHVRYVFQDLRRECVPDVRYQQNELIERLGKAITRRRQLFMYWKRHRDKLSAKLSTKADPVKDYQIAPSQAANMDGEATLEAHLNGDSPAPNKAHSEKTKSAFTATTATLFVHRDDNPDDLQSMISSATTARGLDGGIASLPPPPKVPLGKDFECPYCFTICPAKYLNERNWRIHLLKDLQPYACTYARCETGSQLYSSRHEWISHETHAHRKKWRCPAHPHVEYVSKKDYAKHLEQEHEQGTESSNLPTMLDIGKTTSSDTPRVCPLCLVEEASSARFYNHVAFHLESIAAFSLPRNTAGPEDDMESVHTASTNANRGSRGSESFETLSAFEEEPQRLSEAGEEAVSLTQQLVSSCVKGYQVISEARGIPEDAKYLQVRLKIEAHRFINWAKVVELTEERDLSGSVNKDLACEFLVQKEELLSNYVKEEMKVELQSSTEPITIDDVEDKNEDEFSLLAKLSRIANETGHRFPDKVRWTTFDKTKFDDEIKKLSSLNDYLMELLTNQQRKKLDAVEIKTNTEIRESNSKLETPANSMRAHLEVEHPREFQTPGLKIKDEVGDDVQSLNQTTALIEYGADPVYATGFAQDQILRLPANTDQSALDGEALPHLAPPQRVKFSAFGDIESDVKYLEVAPGISSLPPDANQLMGPDEVGPSTALENVSPPRITLQAPRDLSALETPFVKAVLQGDKPSARRILENSIFPRLKDYDLRDAINIAVENEDYAMVEMLLDVGESNSKRRHSWRSLHSAARKGNLKLVEMLVQKGATVNVKSDEDGSNPLHQAAKYGHKQIVDRLMSLAVVTQDGSGVDEVDCNGMLPLHFAARHAHEETAGTLIMASDINQRNSYGRTPLIEATRNGADKIVKLLLGNDADVNSKDEEGKTALHEVVNNGHALIFDMLLTAGADVDSKTSFGFTPLHYVFNHKETTIARMLLEKGADVNARTANGETPLHLVAGVPKQHRLVNLFLCEGADPNLISHPFGIDAYERQSPLRTACSVLGNVETVRVLIEGGADIHADTVRTSTALQAACQCGDSEIVNLLIELGASVGAPRPLAPSPLQEAARNGHLEIVQLLLNKDADIDEQSDLHGTALEAACHGNHRSIAEFLIRQGANLTACDAFGQRGKYGRTCVDLALAQDDIDLAQFLVKTIQDTLGFEHRETLAAEEKLKSALESRDDIEGHSSELQQTSSRDSDDSDSDSGLIFPRHRTQSSMERVHEDTRTLSSIVLQAREKLLQTMERPEDRSLLLRHENRILRFINSTESMGDSIDEGPRSPHSQTLIETLARYYGLRPIVSRADNHLKLYRGDETIRPARLWMLESLQSTSSVAELPRPSGTGIESEQSSSDRFTTLERPRSPKYGRIRFSDGRYAKLLEAMNNENDRSFLLRIERRIIDFVEQDKDGYVDLPVDKATDRILIRRLAEHYGLSYVLVDELCCVRLQRISDARLRLPISLSQLEISLSSNRDPREPETVGLQQPLVKGILKPPKNKFPETADAIREGVAPLKESGDLKGIPHGARWTKIDRKLVSPAALEEAHERFEERMDHIIVLRVLTKEEISKLAERTQEIREDKEGSDAASKDGSNSRPQTPPTKKRGTSDVRIESYEAFLRHVNIIAEAQNMMRVVPDLEMSGEAVVLPAVPNEDTSKLPLQLKEGQVVEVQRRNEAHPGWLEVTHHRIKHGLFPESRLLLTRLLGELLKKNPETFAKVGGLELIQPHRRDVEEAPASPLGESESIRGNAGQDVGGTRETSF